MQKKVRFGEILLSSCMGSVYVCIKVVIINKIMPFGVLGMVIENIATYITVPLIMIRIAFGRSDIREGFKRYFMFVMMFIFISGVSSFIIYNIFAWNVAIDNIMGRLLVLVGSCLCIEGIKTLREICTENIRKKTKVIIQYKENEIEGVGLFDTGNSLMDPVYGKPVTICEDSLFGIDVRGNVNLEELQGAHLIPFRTIGNSRGMLLAIRVNCLKIYKGTNAAIEIPDAVVGLYSGKLSLSNEYNIILHPLNNRKVGEKYVN